MVFNDDSLKQGIVNDIDFILGTTTTDFSLANKTRCVNRWLDRATGLILQADGKWEWDDSNQTDLPIATTSLVANQKDYAISGATFLKVLKVECKDSTGDWRALDQIDTTQRKKVLLDDPDETAGSPTQFDLRYNSIFLFPKPSYASSAGLKVYYQRVCDYFVAGDTTQEPGFAAPFHRLLSYGASLDFAIANNMSGKISLLREEIAKLEFGLVEHYSSRNKDFRNRLSLAKEDYSTDDYEGEVSANWS